MPAKKAKFLRLIFLFAFLLLVVRTPEVRAISACTATVSPTAVGTSTSTTLTFSVSNDDDQGGNVIWVKITAPSGDYLITGGSASDWSTSASSSQIIFENGNLSASSSQSFSVNITTGSSAVSASAFTVEISDSAGGGNAATCSGSTSVSIISLAISSVSVSEIGNSSVKITWTTNEQANSAVQYGTSASYGSTNTDSSQVTSHSIEITSLSANTTYHYKVQSTDANNNMAETSDNTFVTAKASTTVTVTTTTTTTVTKTVADVTVPAISITTNLKGTFTEAPSIFGKASDDVGVSKVEYSLDNGRNWLPVDELSAIGAKTATFEFTPTGPSDGNYKIYARVVDPSGNQTTSKSYTLVIDRLPPMVGATVFSIGPQVLLPGADGSLLVLAGVDQRITLSSVGGAITIDLVSRQKVLSETSLSEGEIELKEGEKLFSLVKNPDNGLWNGTLSFTKPGIYQIEARSIDGAKNKTLKSLGSVMVLPDGKIYADDGSLENAEIVVYFFEPISQKFVVWEGKSFGQENPQRSGKDGEYKLFLPSGKYYLEIKVNGYKKERSEIFELGKSLPINSSFKLKKLKQLGVGKIKFNLPDISFARKPQTFILSGILADVPETGLKGSEISYFTLQGEREVFKSTSILGKPALITFINTWLPQASSQLAILGQIKNENINLLVIVPQESNSKVYIFSQVGAYDLPVWADPDGKLIEPFNVRTLPTHVFLNRKGVVKEVKLGVLGRDEILKNLLN